MAGIRPNGWHNEPKANPIPESPISWYQLEDAMLFYWRGDYYRVPSGFKWNAASVPWFLWFVVPPTGLILAATAPHDWLYGNDGCINRVSIVDNHLLLYPVKLSRAQSDAVIRDIYRWDVKQWIKRERPNLGRRWLEIARPWLTWAGVRIFGIFNWSHA